MEFTENLKREYRTLQLSGLTNMFDRKAVQYYAFQANMYELVNFIEESGNSGYGKLISNYDSTWDELEPYHDKVDFLVESFGR